MLRLFSKDNDVSAEISARPAYTFMMPNARRSLKAAIDKKNR